MGNEKASDRSSVRPRIQRIFISLGVAVIIYIGSLYAFRLFRTYEFSLAHESDPQHNLVVFSRNPEVQQFARNFYSPLINTFPGHCYYPNHDEMRLLNREL